MSTPATVSCPTCRSLVIWQPENRYRPFCSQRCRLIDLGAWAQEHYTLPARPEADDADEWPQT